MNYSAMIKLAVSMALFGSIGFFTRQTGIEAIELVFVRCICATLFLGALWLLTKRYKTERWERRELVRTVICGVFLVLNWVFLFKAFEEMSISVAISIYNIAPIFVLLFGALFLKEYLSIGAILATACCFFGSVLIVGFNELQSIEALMNSDFIWAFLSACFYALTMITSKTIQHLSSYALTFIQTTVGIVMLAPFCDFTVFNGLTTSNWLYILATGFIHTGFVYYLFFDSVRSLSTVIVSVLVFVDPLVAILLDVLILSFRPDMWQLLGMALIFGGILYTVYEPMRNDLRKRHV